MILVHAAAWLLVAFPFVLLAWLIFDSKTGAKSVGPKPPHVPAGLDLQAFLATVRGIENDRRERGRS